MPLTENIIPIQNLYLKLIDLNMTHKNSGDLQHYPHKKSHTPKYSLFSENLQDYPN